MDNEFDKLSYALGMSMGHNFKASGIDKVNSADFAAGVAAVYEGAEPRLSYDEAKEVIREYFTALEAKQQEAAKEMAARRGFPQRKRRAPRGAHHRQRPPV